jgi:hypothetical protein
MESVIAVAGTFGEMRSREKGISALMGPKEERAMPRTLILVL